MVGPTAEASGQNANSTEAGFSVGGVIWNLWVFCFRMEMQVHVYSHSRVSMWKPEADIRFLITLHVLTEAGPLTTEPKFGPVISSQLTLAMLSPSIVITEAARPAWPLHRSWGFELWSA